jgi:predicted transcriptional regulator YdeE
LSKGWIKQNDDWVLMDQQVTSSPPAFQIIGISFYPSKQVGRPQRYLAGMRAVQIPETPAGWVVREIPAARYAVFETTLAQIADTTDQAFARWLPEACCEHDYPRPHFDFMPPEATRADSPVTVWIPIRHKT